MSVNKEDILTRLNQATQLGGYKLHSDQAQYLMDAVNALPTFRNGIQVEPDEGYLGWTNYPTWAVKLWIDNDEGSYNYWREEAQEAIDLVQARHADSVNAEGHLAQRLRAEHGEGWESIVSAHEGASVFGVYSDLMGYALGSVNWMEIAESLIDEVKEETA